MDESQRAMVAAGIAPLKHGANQHTPIGVPTHHWVIPFVRRLQRLRTERFQRPHLESASIEILGSAIRAAFGFDFSS